MFRSSDFSGFSSILAFTSSPIISSALFFFLTVKEQNEKIKAFQFLNEKPISVINYSSTSL